MKKEKIFWGLFLIFGAVFLLACNLGLVEGVGFWTVIGTIFFAAIFIKSLFHLEFIGIFFSLAFLGIIYAEPLKIEAVTPGPVLGAALLLSIGFGLIFHKHRRQYKWESDHTEYEQVIDELDGDTVRFATTFSGAIKYVNTEEFQKADLKCSFGSMKVYFDNAHMLHDKAIICIDGSFGGMELYIPKTWTVSNQVNCSFGGVEEKNRNAPDGAHTLVLCGRVSFGGLTIIYV